MPAECVAFAIHTLLFGERLNVSDQLTEQVAFAEDLLPDIEVDRLPVDVVIAECFKRANIVSGVINIPDLMRITMITMKFEMGVGIKYVGSAILVRLPAESHPCRLFGPVGSIEHFVEVAGSEQAKCFCHHK